MSNLFTDAYKRLTKAVSLDGHQSNVKVGHFCTTCLAREDQTPEPWCPQHDERRMDGPGPGSADDVGEDGPA